MNQFVCLSFGVEPLTGQVSLKSGTHGLTLKPAGIGTRDYSKFSVDEYNYNDLSQVDGNGFFSNCLNYIDELLSSF